MEDFTDSPFLIPLIIIGFLAILGAFYKSKTFRSLGIMAFYVLFFMIWVSIVQYVIMPATNLEGYDYMFLQLLLQSIPFILLYKRRI